MVKLGHRSGGDTSGDAERAERGPRPKIKEPVVRGQVQEEEEWPEREETRKVLSHGHQGEAMSHGGKSHFGGKRKSRDGSVSFNGL